MDRLQDSELRILICTATYFVLDGVTITIRKIESHLRSRGATVKILSTVPENIDPHLTKDVIIVPGIKIPFKAAGDYSMGLGLDDNTLREIEAYGPNVVHFTVPDFVGLDGIRWCQKNNIAYMGTWHSNYVDYLKFYFIEWSLGPIVHRYIKGYFDQIPTVYVPTQNMIKKMKEEWGYGQTTELVEWGRGVDMKQFSPDRRSEKFRAAQGISESDVVLLWVGRLVPEKRPDIWKATVKRLQEEGYPVKSLVVGSGTYDKYLRDLTHVRCLGFLSGNALGEAYASSDILLFPSDVETFGNVTLEALSSGCVSIVERKCGEHLVEHGVNGLTCTAGDAEGFYQATKTLVQETQLRRQMSVAARQRADKYNFDKLFQLMAENYKDAIDKNRDPSFMQKHLEAPEGAGRNCLAMLCCNYHYAKLIVEPLLTAIGGVQDSASNTAEYTSECISHSRSHLSCASLAVRHAEEDAAIEAEKNNSESHRRRSAKSSTFSLLAALKTLCVCPAGSFTTAKRMAYLFVLLCVAALSMLFIYFSFTV